MMEEPTVEVIEKDGVMQASSVNPPTSDDVDLLPVQGYFNITGRLTGRAKNELAKVLDYARGEVQSDDPTQVLMYLRHLEERMKVPKLDESRLSNVYNYVKQQETVRAAEQMRDSFLK